jgi:ATP-binding cassette subfamily C protein
VSRSPRSLLGLLCQALALAPRARRRRVLTLLLASALCECVALLAFLPALALLLDLLGPAGQPSPASTQLLALLPGEPGAAILLLLVLALLLLRVLLQHLASERAAAATAAVSQGLRRRLLAALANAAWPWLQAQAPGRLAHALVAEVERVGDCFQLASRMVGALLQILLYLAVAAYISWRFTLALAAIALLGLLLHRRLLRRLRRQGGTASDELRQLAGQVTDTLGGLKAVKAMGREAGLAAWLGQRIDRARGQQEQIQRTRTQAQTLQEGLRLAAVIGALWLGAGLFELPTDALLVALACLGQVVGRQGQLQSSAGELARHAPLLDELRSLEAAALAAAEPGGRPPVPEPVTELALRDVTVAQGERAILARVSLTLPHRGLIALLGPSGSGKTTLLDLLAGLRRPDSGAVLLQGRPLTDYDAASWRRRLLLDASLADNLALNDAEVSADGLARALALAGAADFVAVRAGGLQAGAGPQGQALSGGERQRIALARALLRDPAVLLLDEPTAGLDQATAMALGQTLRRLAGERLVVIATHDPALAALAGLRFRVAGGAVTRDDA